MLGRYPGTGTTVTPMRSRVTTPGRCPRVSNLSWSYASFLALVFGLVLACRPGRPRQIGGHLPGRVNVFHQRRLDTEPLRQRAEQPFDRARIGFAGGYPPLRDC